MDTKELLKAHLADLQSKKAERLEAVSGLKSAREAFNQQSIEAAQKADQLSTQINEALGEDFLKLSTEIASVAKALGAVSATEER